MSAIAEEVAVFEATDGDLDDVAALERRAFPVPWKRQYFAAEVGAPFRFNRVARGRVGELAGYVFCAYAGGEIHVNKIATSEAWRRKGIAKLLMQEVFALASRVKATEIYLEVRLSNAPARTFYRSLGFADAGKRPAYYFDGEDALVMVRYT